MGKKEKIAIFRLGFLRPLRRHVVASKFSSVIYSLLKWEISLSLFYLLRRKRKSDNTVDTILRIAWYSQDQWNIEDTYEEWKANAEKALRDSQNAGISVRKVQIDVDELLAWCKSKNIPVDRASRSEFAIEQLYEEMEENE